MGTFADNVQSLAVALGAVIAILAYLKKYIVFPLYTIYQEMRPNGGRSIKDTVKSIRSEILAIKSILHTYLQYDDRAVFSTDPKGNIKAVSYRMCEMIDRDDDDLLGYNWKTFVDPDDRPKVLKEFEEAITDRRSFDSKFAFVRRHGGLTDRYHVSAKVVKDPGTGEVLGYFGILKKEDWTTDERDPKSE